MNVNPEKHLVSVIIPTYNRAHLVGECVESVLAQTYSPVEIIVVDDGSTDNTRDVLSTFGDKITYLYQENAGQATARKRGLEAAKGDYLALLDSDDLWEPGFLQTCIDGLEETGASIFFTNYRKVDQEGYVLKPDCFESDREWLKPYMATGEDPVSLDAGQTHELFVHNLPPGCSASVFLREHLVHYPDPKARMGDDYLFFMDYALSSPISVAFTSEILWTMRIHDSNIRQRQKDYDKIGTNDVYIKSEVLRKHWDDLTPMERKVFKEDLAKEYFNWGYSASNHGESAKAIIKFGRSFCVTPSFKALFAIPKALLKAVLPRQAD